MKVKDLKKWLKDNSVPDEAEFVFIMNNGTFTEDVDEIKYKKRGHKKVILYI